VLLVLEHNIKKRRQAPYSLVLHSLLSHFYADGRVKCNDNLNASRALLILERTRLLKKIGYKCVPPWSLVAWLPLEMWAECKRDLNASRVQLVLERTISLKRIGYKCVPPVESGNVATVVPGLK